MKIVQGYGLGVVLVGFCAASLLQAHSDLVNILDIEPSIIVDLQYCKNSNFTGHVVCDSTVALVRKEVALALQKVQQELLRMGLCLKIWDAYHSPSVEKCLQESIIAGARGADRAPMPGRHTRGTAIDCTLVWADSGLQLPMPTEFDEFTAQACRSNDAIPVDLLANSVVLETVMVQHGFVPSADEWWHYDYQGWENFNPIESAC